MEIKERIKHSEARVIHSFCLLRGIEYELGSSSAVITRTGRVIPMPGRRAPHVSRSLSAGNTSFLGRAAPDPAINMPNNTDSYIVYGGAGPYSEDIRV
ncbi:hypothetical protein E2C01_020152 [Portunus trituberculatus]|uniref:Uncharacterized protein n=1 Tax=Portunus trituberculatus TaxID=210409 RepID=A0A5B7E0R6_PORTR|nr:hypothetical protein [Portunus trituberculatus]